MSVSTMNPDNNEEELKVEANPEADNATESVETEDGYETEEEEEDEDDNEVQNILAVADLSAPIANEENLEEKCCWICFGTELDDPTATWIHPCKCRGTTKWVHQACMQRWIDEKQKGNLNINVECPQCNTAYVIRLPHPTFVVSILDSGDLFIQKICPIITGGACVGSMYWTILTFGAVTLMQTVGHDRALIMMEKTDPMVLLVSLPLIPVGLIIGQMIRWEETALKFLRVTVPKTPIVRSLLPSFAYKPDNGLQNRGIQNTIPPMAEQFSLTRLFCGALFFPTIATFLGATLYKNVPSQLKRTLLGGATFAMVKGVLKIYHKQHSYIRQCQKQIMDYTE